MNILALWCRWRGHRWGRAFSGNDESESASGDSKWWKRCRLCKTVAPVKRRSVKR